MRTTGTLARDRTRDLQHAAEVRAGGERARTGGVDHGAVGERVRVGHPELDHIGARLHAGLGDPQRLVEGGKAAHHVGHQRGALAGRCEGGGDPLDRSRLGVAGPSRRAPLQDPCRRGRRGRRGRVSRRPGRAPTPGVRALERRDDALEAGQQAERGEGLRVGHGNVARTAAVPEVGVLGPGAGIVEAGGDRSAPG